MENETTTGAAAPTPATPPAPSSGKLVGIAIGCERTVPILKGIRDRKPEDTDEEYARILARWTPFLSIKATVRHQARRKVQLAGFRMQAAAKSVGDDPSLRHTILDVSRDFLREHVTNPRTGDDFGPLLVKVEGASVEQPDGKIVDLAEVTDTAELLDLLEEMDILEMVGGAAMEAQQTSRVLGN